MPALFIFLVCYLHRVDSIFPHDCKMAAVAPSIYFLPKYPKRKEVMGVGKNKRALFIDWVRPQKACLSWTKGIRNPLDSDQVCFNFHSLQKQLNNSVTMV